MWQLQTTATVSVPIHLFSNGPSFVCCVPHVASADQGHCIQTYPPVIALVLASGQIGFLLLLYTPVEQVEQVGCFAHPVCCIWASSRANRGPGRSSSPWQLLWHLQTRATHRVVSSLPHLVAASADQGRFLRIGSLRIFSLVTCGYPGSRQKSISTAGLASVVW